MSKCIYCRNTAADTRDHVPPKQLLRTPYPPNLKTVPSCRACNEAFSLDEEYFRTMVIGLFCHNGEADKLFDGPVSRSFDRRSHLEDVFWDSIDVVDGKPIALINQPRFDRVAAKIIHGLHYRETASLLDLDSVFSFSFSEISDNQDSDLLGGIPFDTSFAPDFKFRYNDSNWQLVFFSSFQCNAVVRQNSSR